LQVAGNVEDVRRILETYQISRRRAAEKFRKFALCNPTPIQLTFPLAEVAELAQASLGDLLRGVGKVFIESSRSEEERHCGPEKTAALRLEKERMNVYWTKLGSTKWKFRLTRCRR
jgi:hypothetical protein